MAFQYTPLCLEGPDCAQVQYPQFNSTPSGDRSTGGRVPQLQNFIAYCSQKTGEIFVNYAEFEIFSITQFRTFWLLFLNWSKIPYSGSADVVCEGDLCEIAKFLPDVQLNYAEALLTGSDMSGLALRACHPNRPDEHITRDELYRRVTRLAKVFRRLGVEPGDRVAAVARNNPEAAVAALAAAAIGAVFSSCAPDMGSHAILSRFAPLNPKLVLANLRSEPWDAGIPVLDRVAEVARALGSLTHLIALDDGEPSREITIPILSYAELISEPDDAEFEWERLPFNHPLFVMFSSGTTGAPKCIIHGAGGTLIEHLKEHRLHCDFKPGDRLYFHTSCAWMMWNWQLSALSSGTEVVLFDGPVQGPETLWEIVDRHQVTVFGTSPAYLQLCEGASFSPRSAFGLSSLRSILSTGSILYDRQFDWVQAYVKDVPLQSISGGTDIIGCFVLGNPLLPVHRGEAQCRSLALDVRSLAEPEEATTIGELVCANPFPSRPLGFFGDEDGSRFHASYFSQNPPFWTHGDLIEFTPHGGARLHGRSDGVLNIRGIRVGPAEIYGILQSMDEIVDMMAVEQKAENAPGGAQLVLLVVLRGGLTLTPELAKDIRFRLAMHGSTALVPARCVQVDELPTTFNGKRSETAARDAVNGREACNLGALRNPASLEAIRKAIETSIEADGDSVVAGVKSRAGIQTEAELEEVLQQIVSRRIGLPVCSNDSLLDLGADSLTILTLLMEVEEFVGYEIPFNKFFLAPSVKGLIRLVLGIANSHVTQPIEQPKIRPAAQDDVASIFYLLHDGFKNKQVSPGDWCRLFDYVWVAEKPNLGFVLTVGLQIVGFIGTIYSRRSLNGQEAKLVCNLTSWYVRPEYQGWGLLLLKAAIEDKAAIYTSLTAGRETKAMLQALHFTPLAKTRFFLPGLNAGTLRTGSLSFECRPERVRGLLSEADRRIFDDHAPYDLLHLVVREGSDQAYFIFKRRAFRAIPTFSQLVELALRRARSFVWFRLTRKRSSGVGPVRVPVSQLLYCSDPTILVRHFERIKLAVLKRQRTILLSAHERFVPPTIRAIPAARSNRYWISPNAKQSDLDLLYSELVLLPI